jgi:hypothetical protein
MSLIHKFLARRCSDLGKAGEGDANSSHPLQQEIRMTSPQAILTGAVLIAASIVFAYAIQPAHAQRNGGPYMIVHNGNPNANSSVFRLDTSSGEVAYCFIGQNTELFCTRAAK